MAMLVALLQTIALPIVYQLVQYGSDGNVTYYGLLENEGFKNYTFAINSPFPAAVSTRNATVSADNSTLGQGTSVSDESLGISMTRTVIITGLLFPLLYYWHIWLERTFPRGVNVTYNDKIKVDDDLEDPREEVAVKNGPRKAKSATSRLA